MNRMIHGFFNRCVGGIAGHNLKLAIQLQYLGSFGRLPDLKRPKTINEKMQYLKLYTYKDDPLITQCADKYAVREYIHRKDLDPIMPELYGVYRTAEEIEWDKLPEKFVLKCNHGSGFNILCKDKSILDVEMAKEKLTGWLATEFGRRSLEPHYKSISRRIIAEEYLGDDIHTYKFYCFNGEPRVLYVSSNEDGVYDKYYDYFDMDWNHLKVGLRGHLVHNDDEAPSAPSNFSKMKEICGVLSSDFPFVRVDLYDVESKVYFSELTFTPTGGKMHLNPPETEKIWGEWLTLP